MRQRDLVIPPALRLPLLHSYFDRPCGLCYTLDEMINGKRIRPYFILTQFEQASRRRSRRQRNESQAE